MTSKSTNTKNLMNKEFDVFIKIMNKKGKILLQDVYIYRHPCMEVTEFNDVFLQNFLEKLSYKNKEIILTGLQKLAACS